MQSTEPDVSTAPVVHVAVGVVINRQKQILIARRNDQQHQGGLWEFPGGKVMADESVRDALAREFREEVNIAVRECGALLKIDHDYGDKRVLLDVWLISVFAGEAQGCEGQPVRWVSVADIDDYDFPAANAPILEAIKTLLS